MNIIQDEKRSDIYYIDGREVNKENYPEGFDFRLIAGTTSSNLDPVIDFGEKVLDMKLIDPNKFKVD